MTLTDETVAELVDELFLLGRLIRVNIARQGSDVEGMPQPLLGVLWALETRGPMPQNQLAGILCVSESVLSRQISKLVADGLIGRGRLAEDGRVCVVALTDAGREAMSSALRSRFDRVIPRLSGWSENDARDAITSLERIREAFAE
ncbi:MarR family transcriptional regulator [Gordonia sp. ABSL1-1]|uniref:MarR family winged helix-turn-helix transcriptional regulator n=1 Tax=Gordonia sp. ABSL1-1 TaxID=3053923 RepID=UPI00257289E4|nr:MarR family transcriptional regulator [Gordonia sp. ABSL1-1]MDL9937727.1 MarR family transcriptional regulator [Gordonia sp. ABSL1-1]